MNAFGESTIFECEDLGSLMAYMSVIELGEGVGVSKSSFHQLEFLFSEPFGACASGVLRSFCMRNLTPLRARKNTQIRR